MPEDVGTEHISLNTVSREEGVSLVYLAAQIYHTGISLLFPFSLLFKP